MSRPVLEVADWPGSSVDRGDPPALTDKISTQEPVSNRLSLRDISAIITYLAEDLSCSGERTHPLQPGCRPCPLGSGLCLLFIYLFVFGGRV